MTSLRIQLSRKRGWRMLPDTVKVSRPGMWGNPWLKADHTTLVLRFRLWLAGDPNYMRGDNAPDPQRDFILANLGSLRGKNLACWCRLCPTHKDGKPLGVTCTECEPCHADVLLELANK